MSFVVVYWYWLWLPPVHLLVQNVVNANQSSFCPHLYIHNNTGQWDTKYLWIKRKKNILYILISFVVDDESMWRWWLISIFWEDSLRFNSPQSYLLHLTSPAQRPSTTPHRSHSKLILFALEIVFPIVTSVILFNFLMHF